MTNLFEEWNKKGSDWKQPVSGAQNKGWLRNKDYQKDSGGVELVPGEAQFDLQPAAVAQSNVRQNNQSRAESDKSLGYTASIRDFHLPKSDVATAMSALSSQLKAGETLLWAGSPDRKNLQSQFYIVIVVLLLMSAVLIVINAKAGESFWLQFILPGIPVVVSLFWLNWYKNVRNTIYGITDQRIIYLQKQSVGFAHTDLPLSAIRDVKTGSTGGSGGTGSVRLLTGCWSWNVRWLTGLSNVQQVARIITHHMNSGLVTSAGAGASAVRWKIMQVLIPIVLSLTICVRLWLSLFNQPSYEVYVPENLQPGQKYPLIVGLTPDGHGKDEIDVLKPACNQNQSIILASNDVKNGPFYYEWAPKVTQAIEQAMKKYPVDRNRIYASGFSGGGMSAYWLVEDHPDLIKGLIINTGMMPYASDPPKDDPIPGNFPKNKHAVFLASPTDFRYKAMKKNKELLEKQLGWKVDWLEFTGGHKYAPTEKYIEAVRLLENGQNAK